MSALPSSAASPMSHASSSCSGYSLPLSPSSFLFLFFLFLFFSLHLLLISSNALQASFPPAVVPRQLLLLRLPDLSCMLESTASGPSSSLLLVARVHGVFGVQPCRLHMQPMRVGSGSPRLAILAADHEPSHLTGALATGPLSQQSLACHAVYLSQRLCLLPFSYPQPLLSHCPYACMYVWAICGVVFSAVFADVASRGPDLSSQIINPQTTLSLPSD